MMYERSMPAGPPEVHVHNFLPLIEKDGMTLLPYNGLVKGKHASLTPSGNAHLSAEVLPDRSRTLVVLPWAHEGRLLFPSCRACVEENNQGFCTHENEEDRTLTGTWTSAELNVTPFPLPAYNVWMQVALNRGTKLVRLIEVWHWKEWRDDFYKEYFK